MDGLIENYNKKPKIKIISGDFVDRLHGSITISFLFVLLVLVIFKQAIYSNIICWFPLPANYFLPVFVNFIRGEYLNQFCWINSTYLIPDQYESDNYDLDDHTKTPRPYYQFIMFILIGQMLMFHIPSLIWQILTSNTKGYMKKLLQISSTVNIQNSNKAVEEFLKIFKPLRKSKVIKRAKSGTSKSNNEDEHLASSEKSDGIKMVRFEITEIDSIDESQEIEQDKVKQKTFKVINPLKGLTMKYFVLKILNLINVVAQMFILNEIFGGHFLDYGLRYASKLWNGKNPLLMTKEFPIFTLCDALIHEPNRKVHHHTIQCILTMNVLFEKFYVLVYFWYIVLVILTFFNITSWLYEISFSSKAHFLFKYLKIQSKMLNENESLPKLNYCDVENFQKTYLGIDGLVMLLIIKNVVGDVTFIKILGALYNDFYKEMSEELRK